MEEPESLESPGISDRILRKNFGNLQSGETLVNMANEKLLKNDSKQTNGLKVDKTGTPESANFLQPIKIASSRNLVAVDDKHVKP